MTTIYLTADVITPDDTDTDGYGDPCEPGHGYTIASGWVCESDPFTVYENREDVAPVVIHSDDEVRAAIEDIIGAIDHEEHGTFYATDGQEDYGTGQTSVMAAHIVTD